MPSDASLVLLGASVAGVGGGLWLLARGLAGYRGATRLDDVPTSRISSMAVGEVRVSGVVETAELALVSPLTSRACVYYRARVRESDGRDRRSILDEERAVGFRVRDATGDVRVFPRGASWDVPSSFEDSDDPLGGSPPGLSLRRGPSLQPAAPDRAALVTRLLTVRRGPDGASPGVGSDALDTIGSLSLGGGFGSTVGAGRRSYEEALVAAGDTVTIVGTALPFDQLPDPDSADLADGALAGGGPLAATADPEIAADLAAARAAGTLETDPEEAWGNAAIPGFGIGRPVRAPELDPAARPIPVADAATAERFERTFEIAPDALVLAASPDHPLLVSAGSPAQGVARGEDRFLLGLAGAVVAIVSAVVLALQIGGGALT